MRRDVPAAWWWAAASAAAMVVGAFAPWLTIRLPGFISVTWSGTRGHDGWIVFGAAAVAIALLIAFLAVRLRWLTILGCVAGGAGAAIAGYDISDIANVATGFSPVQISSRWGIYLSLGSSISLVLACAVLFLQSRRPS